ncbi:hypothetical protein D9M70_578080 [compost metagenome]
MGLRIPDASHSARKDLHVPLLDASASLGVKIAQHDDRIGRGEGQRHQPVAIQFLSRLPSDVLFDHIVDFLEAAFDGITMKAAFEARLRKMADAWVYQLPIRVIRIRRRFNVSRLKQSLGFRNHKGLNLLQGTRRIAL